MNGKVGVVVPVYGTEKYIANCIESIIKQTYTNFRLILVDDATPDNAGVICDEYAKKDKRITVIHQLNTGVSRARANGVAIAEDCDFITFVDSDDSITIDALQIMVSAMTSEVDMVISYRVANIPEIKPIDKPQITTKEYRELLLHEKFSCAPWGKLFRRTLFDETVFDIPREIFVGEDMLMNIRISYKTAKSINVIRHDIYNYNIYDGNTTKRFVANPEYDILWYRLILASIQDAEEKDEYIRFCLPYRYQKYINFGGWEVDNKSLLLTDFYKELKKDIEFYKYPLSFRKKLLFYSANPILRFIVIYTKKLISSIKECIKHPDDKFGV